MISIRQLKYYLKQKTTETFMKMTRAYILENNDVFNMYFIAV